MSDLPEATPSRDEATPSRDGATPSRDGATPSRDGATPSQGEPLTALVLAGRRGPTDPLALAQGVAHRALLEVEGTPMLLRVVRTLRASPDVGRIIISIDDPAALDAVAELRSLIDAGAVVAHRSLDSPSRSVLDVLEGQAQGEPVLVTTADHALLTGDMVEHFAGAARRSSADVLVGLVAATLLRAHYPESPRTYLHLRDDSYSGANLFAFRTPGAKRAAAFWVRAEKFRKQPWRLVGVFGPTALLLFLLRRLDLDAALERASRAIGARVTPVRMPFAEAAIDVDRPADLELVSRILAQRKRSPSAEKQPLDDS